MSILKLLLLPFAMLYDLIMNIRNRLYDQNLKPSTRFDLPVIGVGNLAVGGTGKTPMVEHLIRLLSSKRSIATLSRGYGRKTKGFRIATEKDSAITIGDEPFQLYIKYHHKVSVTVGEERALAIPTILQEQENIEVILMDDGFQHRSVKPGFQVLLTEYNRPFYDDHVLPYGRLREGPEGADRADVIVVTKCPDHLEEEAMMKVEHAIHVYSKKPVFFSGIRYGDPQAFGGHSKPFSSNVILLSGIANHQLLEEYVARNFSLIKHFANRDHHHYRSDDLVALENFVQKQSLKDFSILTTEKDWVKLDIPEFYPYFERLPIFYLPIEMQFLRNGREFDTMVESFVDSFYSE